MNHTLDHAGLDCTGAHPEATAAYAQALRAFHCCQGDPVGLITPALEQQPDFAMGWLMHGWLHALSTEPAARTVVEQDANTLRKLALNRRERLHLEALVAFNCGHWQQAGRLLLTLSREWPQDALALQAGHYIDFLRGDSKQLRDRIAMALPAWDENDPGSHALWGMWAFGLEECGQYEEAERAGLKALELEPADAWAHHAVTHVFEMQGRSADGIRWMREREPHWNDNHFLAIHNAWHWALFNLELGRLDDALHLYDTYIRGGRSTAMVDLVDASAMLWRLEFMGVDIGPRWAALADDWEAQAEPGHYTFNDFHAMLAWVGSGRSAKAREWLTAQNSTASPSDLTSLARDVGEPLLSALQERQQGRTAAAVTQLQAIRPVIHRMGGSHAQRDLVDLLLIDSAIELPDPELAAKLIAKRLPQRPQDGIGLRIQDRLRTATASETDQSKTLPVTVTATD